MGMRSTPGVRGGFSFWPVVRGAAAVVLAVAIAGAGPVSAEKVVTAVPVKASGASVVNLADLAKQIASRPPAVPEKPFLPPDISVPEEPVPPSSVIPSKPSPARPLVASPGPAANFAGIADANLSIPPDTMGVVGPSHVLNHVNVQVSVLNRTGGVMVAPVGLTTFWNSGSPSLGVSGVFDPRTQYDPFNDRWLISAASSAQAAGSSILIGSSQTGDPTGAWNLFKFTADGTSTLWADYPMLGFNKDWVAVSVNLFTVATNAYTRTDVYVLNKANLYAGNTTGSTVINAGASFNLYPAETLDNTLGTLHFIRRVSSAGGTVARSHITATPPATPTLTLDSATVTSTLGGWTAPSGNWLPQSGGAATMDSGDARIQQVIVRTVTGTTTVWFAQNILLPSGGATANSHAAAQWWQINGTPTSTVVVQMGRVEDPTATQTNAGFHFAYPSLSVNKFGDMLIGYSRFSTSDFPSAGYSYRAVGDALGTTRDPFVFKAGLGSYFKTFGAGSNRWGDYSHTNVDPTNDRDFWTVQEYAAAPVGGTTDGTGRWGTWWANVLSVTTPVELQKYSVK